MTCDEVRLGAGAVTVPAETTFYVYEHWRPDTNRLASTSARGATAYKKLDSDIRHDTPEKFSADLKRDKIPALLSPRAADARLTGHEGVGNGP
jgi:hypothetical protein